MSDEIALLYNVFEKSINEIYIFNADTLQFIHVNYGGRTNTGYSMEELSTLTAVDIKPELTDAKFRELVKPLITGVSESLVFTTVHQRKNATTYPVEVHLQYDSQQNPPVFFAIIYRVCSIDSSMV